MVEMVFICIATHSSESDARGESDARAMAQGYGRNCFQPCANSHLSSDPEECCNANGHHFNYAPHIPNSDDSEGCCNANGTHCQPYTSCANSDDSEGCCNANGTHC